MRRLGGMGVGVLSCMVPPLSIGSNTVEVFINIYMCVCMNIYIYGFMYTYLYLLICIYVYISIYLQLVLPVCGDLMPRMPRSVVLNTTCEDLLYEAGSIVIYARVMISSISPPMGSAKGQQMVTVAGISYIRKIIVMIYQ
jgi:hypothetical protein